MSHSVLIIGGGASGLVAAAAAARSGAKVLLLEHMDRIGKKLLSTGNGKCNMTNLAMDASCYRCSQKDFPMEAVSRFPVEDTLSFFEGIGIVTKNKNGYVYPYSEQASSVLDCLRFELSRLGVEILAGCHVESARKERRGFFVRAGSKAFRADTLILSTGSKAAPATGSDGSGYGLAKGFGHRVICPLPALVQLRCRGNYFKQLAGVRCAARLSLRADGDLLAEDTGEVQFTDYGISGIPTFQVSRFASVALAQKRKVTAVLDFFPMLSYQETERFVMRRRETLGDRRMGDFFTGAVHKKLSGVLCQLADASPQETAARQEEAVFRRLAGLLKEFPVEVAATNPFSCCQVCCGGVDTREVCPSSMESLLVPGLYFAGELLDVDGICGGYNLQWAWSSGMIAGSSAAGGIK